MIRKVGIIAAALSLALSGASAMAKVSEADANKLGNELTPLGAEKAGNADGSILLGLAVLLQHQRATQWVITIQTRTLKIKCYLKSRHKTTKNTRTFYLKVRKSFSKLTPETFRMPVYPTRRSASNPQFIYDATKVNATSAELLDGGNGIKGAVLGIPFPIPQNGLEAIWNHILRYRGEAVQRNGGQAAVTTGGDYNVIGFDEQLLIKYAEEGATPEKLTDENVLFMFKQKVTKPARLAGTALLVHETVDQVKEPRKAWTYNTGQRRVRLAPNIAYDTPGTAADGLRTTDDFDMFNGSPNRYNWKLVGKKEMFVAYNNYALHSDNAKYDDILKPNHVNPDL